MLPHVVATERFIFFGTSGSSVLENGQNSNSQWPASKSNDGGQSAIIQDFPSLSPLSVLHVKGP